MHLVDGSRGLPDVPEELPEAEIARFRRKWRDVAYADLSPAQKMDIYVPETGAGPFPVILYVHGGAFAMGDKRDEHVRAYLNGLDRGYALASLNYRLSGEATFPVGLQDVKAAVRWVRANGVACELDGDRVAAWGASSGGNYAAMLCVTSGIPLFEDPVLGNAGQSSAVQVAVDWFGPTDFLQMDAQLAANGLGPCDHGDRDSPESRYLGAKISEVPERVALANPMTWVGDEMAPILIQHGIADSVVPCQQSVEFARVIEERVGADRYGLDLFEGAVHDDPVFGSPQNVARVFAFIDRYLK